MMLLLFLVVVFWLFFADYDTENVVVAVLRLLLLLFSLLSLLSLTENNQVHTAT